MEPRYELRSRLRSLMFIRAVLVTILLGTTTLLYIRTQETPNLAAFWLIALIYLLTFFYSLLLDKVSRLSLFALLQILGDLLLISAVLVLSGGTDSPMSILYSVSIVTGSILLEKPGGYATAALSCILLGSLALLESQGMIPDAQIYPFPRYILSLSDRLSQLFSSFFGFFIIGSLSGHLAERLRKSNELLEERSQNLLDLKQFHSLVLQSIDSGLVTTDLQGKITSANRAALNLVGCDFRGLMGKSIADLFPALGNVELAPYRTKHRFFQVVHSLPDGRTRHIEIAPSSLADSTGKLDGSILVLRDVTELKKLETIKKEWEKLSAFAKMAATIAHEIRNPLASMRGSIELLSRELKLSGTEKRLMAIVLRESDRLNCLVNDFLNAHHLKPPKLELVNLAYQVQDILLILRNDESCHNIEIKIDLHAQSIPVRLDAGQFRQVMWNLVQNSVRAMASGGTLTISTRRCPWPQRSGHEAHSGREAICLTVHDNGHGIDPETLINLLEPSSRKFKRLSGLGLSVIRRIVAGHQGHIEIASVPGQETEVKIFFPLSKLSENEATAK